VPVREEEAFGCNLLSVGRDVVMASGFDTVRSLLADRGFDVHEVDLSEFTKADGGPTCLSLLV
jgi:dimethylargininase